jgi:pimeloyl-ACP methyl ester carboxylesterase
MEEKVQIAYRDMGLSLKNGGVEAFFQTKGWEIVKEPSLYTRNAFLNPFQNPVEIQNWKKYLILPSKTPISSKEELQKLSIPVTILANKNDLCHPFSYGEYLQKYIPDSKLTQIPDKDTDSNLHRQMINQAVREIMAGCGH